MLVVYICSRRLILFTAASRLDSEVKAARACEAVLAWIHKVRLTLSVGQTKIILLKRNPPGRPLSVRMEGELLQIQHDI